MIATVLLLAAALAPQSTSPHRRLWLEQDFTHGNGAGWSFFGAPGHPLEVIEASGGNPGAFLHTLCAGSSCLDTFAPQLRTPLGVPSVFTGNWRTRRVDAIGVDLAIFHVDFSSAGRPLSLVLRSDPGTPGSFADDVVVYLVGTRNVPMPNGHWRRYGFPVASASATLPAGWVVQQGSGNANADWNQVMTDVDQVTFFFGDPSFFFIFQQWELGADSIRIRLDPTTL
jgi:hypothetical protein